MSRGMYLLHMDAFWVCLAIGLITFVALFYSFIKYRRSKAEGDVSRRERVSVEILWASIPVLILVLLSVPAIKVLYRVESRATAHKPVKALAQQPLDAKPLTKDELMKLGRATYNKSCAVCHQMAGQGLPPAFPALKGAPVSTGPIDAQIDVVLNGKPGTSMQAFRNQLSDKELAAVVTYVRNAWGNAAIVKKNKQVELVQPHDVAKVSK